jgi:hypothetical protein
MLRKSGVQYLVLASDIPSIFKNINNMSTEMESIMLDALVKRVVCKRPQKNKGKEEWIRILEGDIEYIGDTQRCTMTYITEIKEETKKNKIKDTLMLKVDNFEDAIHFASEMGFNKKSYQENIRSKFLFTFIGVTYILRFDIWAQIPEYTVIEIGLLSSGQTGFQDIVQKLKIENYAQKLEVKKGKIVKLSEEETKESLKERTSIDIDELYKIVKKTKASEIPYITLDDAVYNFFCPRKSSVGC